MTTYVNKSLGVVNVAGQFAAPGKTVDVDPKSPGLDRLVKRGVLSKAGGEAKQDANDPEVAEREALAAQYEERFGEKPHHAMKADTIREKLAAEE